MLGIGVRECVIRMCKRELLVGEYISDRCSSGRSNGRSDGGSDGLLPTETTNPYDNMVCCIIFV